MLRVGQYQNMERLPASRRVPLYDRHEALRLMSVAVTGMQQLMLRFTGIAWVSQRCRDIARMPIQLKAPKNTHEFITFQNSGYKAYIL